MYVYTFSTFFPLFDLLPLGLASTDSTTSKIFFLKFIMSPDEESRGGTNEHIGWKQRDPTLISSLAPSFHSYERPTFPN